MEISQSRPIKVSFSDSANTKREFDSESEHSGYSGTSSDGLALSPRGPRTEHTMELANGKNRPWAILRVNSSARSPDQIPMFFEGEHITGSLDLILQSGDPIHSISINIKGKLTTGPNIHDAQVFLDKMTLLWNRSMGNPRLPSSSSESQPKFTSKLLGDYYWPFSIHLPREVTLWSAEGLGEQNFRLPETFMERLTRASVHYEMTVLITRGILRSDSRIETKIAYFPCTRPSPPSRLQQIAYQQGSRLPGPESDPDGWFTHDLTVRGMLRGRAILANCQFSLARPV